MEIKLIKTDQDYQVAVRHLEALGDTPGFEENLQLIDQFELLSKLIDDYDHEHFPIAKGNPIDIILMRMDALNIARKDLPSSIGSSGVISEVLNKKRGLSKNMIREFSVLLNIDQDILNTPYDLIPKTTLSVRAGRPARAARPIKLPVFRFIEERHQQVAAFSLRVKEAGMLLNIANYNGA